MKNNYGIFKKVRLWGINPSVDFSKVLSVKAADSITNPISMYNAIGGLYYCLHDALIRDREYHYDESSKAQFLLFYGKYNLRADHLHTFLKFAKSFEDCDAFYARPFEKKHIDILGLLRCLIMMPIWLLQALFKRVPFKVACNAMPYIQLCAQLSRDAAFLLNKNYSFVVFYYDAAPDENYMAQLYKKKGVITMTLQHGIFSRKKHIIRSIIDMAFELSESISDYYLAWNQYTKDEAIKVGLNPNRVVVLGAPKYIDFKEPINPHLSKCDVFGVILNNSAFDHHNRKLIEMAEIIYQETGMKYKLRYHPQMSGNEYTSLCKQGFLKLDEKGNSIVEYADSVAFTIISSSSVFVDLLLLKHPAYRLIVSEEDTYSSVPFNSFSSVSELLSVMSQSSDNRSAFEYLCNSYDVYRNYRVFFDSILNEKKSF